MTRFTLQTFRGALLLWALSSTFAFWVVAVPSFGAEPKRTLWVCAIDTTEAPDDVATASSRDLCEFFRRYAKETDQPVKALLMTERGKAKAGELDRRKLGEAPGPNENGLFPDRASLEWAFRNWLRPAPNDLVLLSFRGEILSIGDTTVGLTAALPGNSNRRATPLSLDAALKALLGNDAAASQKKRVVCLLERTGKTSEQDRAKFESALEAVVARSPNVSIWATTEPTPGPAANPRDRTALAAAVARELKNVGTTGNLASVLRGLRRAPGLSGPALRVFGTVGAEASLTQSPVAVSVDPPSGKGVVQRGHAGQVDGVLLTADGSRMLTAGADSTVRVWKRPTDPAAHDDVLIDVRPDHMNGVKALAARNDETWVVTGDGMGALRAWNPTTGAFVGPAKAVKEGAVARPVDAVAFLPRANAAAALSAGTLWIWDYTQGVTPTPIKSPVRFRRLAVAEQSTGIAMAAVGSDSRVHMFDDQGARVHVLDPIGEDRFECLALSDDGTRLAVGGRRGTVWIWKVPRDRADWDGVEPLSQKVTRGPAISALVFSHSGRLAAAGGDDVYLFGNDMTQTPGSERAPAVRQIRFSEDSAWLGALGDQPSPLTWRVTASGRMQAVELTTTRGASGGMSDATLPTCFGFSADSRELVAGNQRGAIHTWTLPAPIGAPGAEPSVALLRLRDDPARGQVAHLSAVKTRDGDRLLLQVTRDGIARLWDIRGAADPVALAAYPGYWSSGVIVPDGSGIVLTSLKGSLSYYALKGNPPNLSFAPPLSEKGRELTRWGFHTLAVSPDSELVAAGSPDGPLACVWSLKTGERVKTVRAHQDGVTAVSFSGDSRHLLTAARDGTAQTWRLDRREEGPETPEFAGEYDNAVIRAFFQPGFNDPPAIVTGGSGPHRGEVVWRRPGPEGGWRKLADLGGQISALACSPDGRWLAAACDTDVVPQIWNTDNSRKFKLNKPEPHSERINAIAFWEGDSVVITASDDATIRIWDLENQMLRGTLSTLADLDEWVVYTPDGVFDGSDKGCEKLIWRTGGPGKVFRSDQFRGSHFQPGLLRMLAEGRRPTSKTGNAIGEFPPPDVRIISPAEGESVALPATVEIAVADLGGGIGRLNVWLGNMPMWVSDSGQPDEALRGRRYRIPIESLPEGSTEVFARATNHDGTGSSRRARRTIVYNEPKTEPGPRDGKTKPRLFVLSVGVSHYADHSLDRSVAFSENDALRMELAFRKFSPKLFEGGVTTIALKSQDATKAAILENLNALRDQTTFDDTLVLFLAGHGDVLEDRYHFFPHEMKLDAKGVGMPATGLTVDDLTDYLSAPASPGRKQMANNRVIIIDTCASGKAVEEFMKKARTRAQMSDLSREYGNLMIVASRADEKAHEYSELKHGLLTYTLLSGLGAVDERLDFDPLGPKSFRIPTLDPAKRIAVHSWFRYAMDHAPEVAQSVAVRQLNSLVAKSRGSDTFEFDKNPPPQVPQYYAGENPESNPVYLFVSEDGLDPAGSSPAGR